MGRWKKDTMRCQALTPINGVVGHRQCTQRAEWVVSHDAERHWCCDEHIKTFLSDKTMNIVLPAKEYARISKK